MEGRVLWYKPSSQRGCLVSDVGKRFGFRTRGQDDAIHGGARVRFKVSAMDGDLVAVDVRVIESCLDALVHEHRNLARDFRAMITIET